MKPFPKKIPIFMHSTPQHYSYPQEFTKNSIFILLLWIACSVAPIHLFAQTTTWTGGGGDGNWSNTLNWNNGVPNTAGYTAVFGAGTVVITSGIPALVGTLTINNASANVTLQGGSTLDINSMGIGGAAGSSLTVASGMTVRMAASGSTIAPSCFLTVNGTFVVGDGFFMNNNSTSGFVVNNGGRVVITGNAQINTNTPQYNSGSTIEFVPGGLTKNVSGPGVTPSTIPAGVRWIIGGNTNLTVARTIQGATLEIKHGVSFSIGAPINVNMQGKVQIDGTPTLLGSSSIQYGGAGDTLEFIGSTPTNIDNNGPVLAQELSASGVMYGTIVLNKPMGGVVNTIPGPLRVYGDFLMKQGTWNIVQSITGSHLILNGSTNQVFPTASIILAAGTNTQMSSLVIPDARTLVNNGTITANQFTSMTLQSTGSITGNAVSYQVGSVVRFETTTASHTATLQEIPPQMNGGVLVLGSNYLNLSTNCTISGSVTCGSLLVTPASGGRIATGAFSLRLTNAVNNIANQAGSGIEVAPLGSLWVDNGAALSVGMTGLLEIQGGGALGGTLRLDGTGQVGGAGTVNYSMGPPYPNLLYTGAANKTPTYTEMPFAPSPPPLNANLHVNKAAGSRLNMPGTASDRVLLAPQRFLSLTSGIVQSGQGSNGILRIQNANFSAVTFATTGFGYVDGPLQRDFPAGGTLSSFFFPLGKGGQFLPMMLKYVNSASIVTIAAEAYSAGTGGTPIAPLTALSTSEYWRMGLPLGGTITQMQIGVFRPAAIPTATALGITDNAMPPSSPGGNYTFEGGTPTTGGLLSNLIATTFNSNRYISLGNVSLPVKSALGYQIQLNGSNQEIVAPPRPAYDSLTTFTMEALVRPYWFSGIPPTNPCIFSFSTSTGANFSLNMGASYMPNTLIVNGGTPKTVPSGFGRFQYAHIAVSYSAGVLTYYVNGKLIGTDNITLSPVAGRPFRIGSRGGIVDFWNGSIDEVRIWNTVLPQSVIATWKRRELDNGHPNVANLIGYWRFNDGYPQSAADNSSQANTATLINNPAWIDGSTTAGVVVAPTGTTTGALSYTKIGAGTGSFSLAGTNGGSTVATVNLDAAGNISYTSVITVGQDVRDTVRHSIADPTVTTASVVAEFSPVLTVVPQFVSYNKSTRFTAQSILGGTTPFAVQWTPATGLSNTTIIQPNATLVTGGTYTLQTQDAYGFSGTFAVPVQIQPLTLAFSLTSSTGTTGLPGVINSGNPILMRYGIFRKRATNMLDTVDASVSMHVAAAGGGNAQFSYKYDSTFFQQDRITAPAVTINWINAPIAGGTTQAVVTLFRTTALATGAPIDPVQLTVIISSNATTPVIASFAPAIGGNGTLVTITGANFVNVNNVRFGGIAAQSFVVVSSTTIQARVGAGATGPVTVLAMAGSGNSAQLFTYVQPPTITNFTPTQGASGATVRILGTNFVQPATVRFGGVPANNVDVTLTTELFADVGVGATGNVSVTTPGGTVTSATVFTFFGAPAISSIAPTQGTAGDTITVNGNNFLNVDSVRIGASVLGVGNSAVAQVISPSLVRIILDNTPLSGIVTIFAQGGQGSSPQAFTYIPPPKIDSISPRVGGAGTVLTLYGKNFVNVDSVRYNGVRLQNLMVASQTRLTVTMPNNLMNSTNAVILFTRQGRDTSKTPNLFQYVQLPVITTFQPSAAGVGAWITVTGANFVNVQNVNFNGAKADSIKVLSPFVLQAKVPAAATTGKLSIQAAGGTVQSMNDFRLVLPPEITSFSPTSVSSGATVEILGKEFINVVRVLLGTGAKAVTLANVSVPSETRILATIPAQGASTGTLTVETLQGTATSQTSLTIIIPTGPPPVISSYTPPAAEVGAEVFISGANFVNVLNVSIGGTSAATVKVLSPTSLSFIIPESASSGNLRVTTPNGVAFSIGIFSVLKPLSGEGTTALQRDSSVLVRFYLASGGGWQREESWLTVRPVSSWAGVSIDSGRIVGLRLANNNIQGGLPSYLSELTAARVIDLSNNFLEGQISSSFATMSALQELRLGNNRLTGALPVLSSMASLRVLSVENNRLVGEFPRGVCDLRQIQEVNLSNNALSGFLPSCIGNAATLVRLNCADNLFAGAIPPELGSLTALQELVLAGNMLTGSIPATLGSTTAQIGTSGIVTLKHTAEQHATLDLTLLDLRRNQLTGAIPSSLGTLNNLRTLLLADNRLSGALPVSLGNCLNLQTLDASNNQLSGTLPASLGALQKLQELRLRKNRLSDALPQEMGRMLALTTLQLDSNALTGLTDSLANIRGLRYFTVANNQLSRLPFLRGLDSVNVARNRFQFAALDQIQQARAFVYAPQDSILTLIDTTIQVFTPLSASAQLDVGRHDYQWYKITNNNGNLVTVQLVGRTLETLAFERTVRSDTGVYTCYVRNSKYPALTLVRRTVSIHALPPSAPREIPVLVAPANNAQSIALTTALRWTTIATVSGYEIQISTTADFTRLQWQTTTNNPFVSSQIVPQAASLLNLTAYFWRVRAVSEGLMGAWSDVFRFTTQPANQPLNVETVDLGRVVVGRVSRSAELRVRNLSNVALVIQNVQVQGAQILNFQTQRLQSTDGTLHFRFLSPFTNTVRLDLDEEMALPLVFMPNVVGEYRANVVVTFAPAAGGTPTTLSFASALIGRGGILVIDSLNFGTVTAGVTRRESMRIRNIGLDTVRLQGILLSVPQGDTTLKTAFRLAERSLTGLIVRPNDSLFVDMECASQADAPRGVLRSSATIYSTLDTVYSVGLSAQIRRPSLNDITIATVLLAERNNIAPGGAVTLMLKLQTVASSTARGLRDLYVANTNPIFTGELEFDNNVLALDVTEQGVERIGAVGANAVRYRIPPTRWQPSVSTSGEITDSILLNIRCRAVSGNTNTTKLRVVRFAWDTTSSVSKEAIVVIEKSPDSSFTSAACEAGGMRLTTTAKPNSLRIVSKNPASDEVLLAFSVREDTHAELTITDVLGRNATTLINTTLAAGEYEKNARLDGLASGIYFIRLQTPSGVVVRRLEVVR